MEREAKEDEGQRAFNSPTVRESLPNLFIGLLLLRGAPVRAQFVAATAEDAKTDLPESSLTKLA